MDREKLIILIVDDNPQNLQLLGQRIEEDGYEAAVAVNGSQALSFVKEQKPALILLDIMMPMIDGFETCRILKNDPETRDIPVIFLTAKSDYDDITKAFETGAVDYIIKPFNMMELNARIKTHLELRESRENLKRYNEELEKANRELKEANEIIVKQNQQLNEAMNQLEVAAKVDQLTGLFNRRRIIELIDTEIIRYKRNNKVFCIAISDIDHFKNINDQYGHDIGDCSLKFIAEILRTAIREQDYVARWGGEEFLFLLPETRLSGAVILLEKLRNKIDGSEYSVDDIKLNFALTFGVAEYDSREGMDTTIKKADIALYSGKTKGRNCVVAYDETLHRESESINS